MLASHAALWGSTGKAEMFGVPHVVGGEHLAIGCAREGRAGRCRPRRSDERQSTRCHPGEQEDRQQRPFAAPARRVLRSPTVAQSTYPSDRLDGNEKGPRQDGTTVPGLRDDVGTESEGS